MTKNKRRKDASGTPGDGASAGQIGDMDVQSRVSTGGHMHPESAPELPGDQRGGGTAERNRDRSAGVGEGLPHEGADIPDAGVIGGQTSSTSAARQILDAIEEREPDRGTRDHTAPSRTVKPLRRPPADE